MGSEPDDFETSDLRDENQRLAQATEAMLRRSERALERAEKAEAEVERWKSASGLERGGDPDTITPADCERNVQSLMAEVERLRPPGCARNQDSTSQFCALAEEAALRAADAQNERNHTVGVLQARVAALAVLAEPDEEEAGRLGSLLYRVGWLERERGVPFLNNMARAILADLRQRAGVTP